MKDGGEKAMDKSTSMGVKNDNDSCDMNEWKI